MKRHVAWLSIALVLLVLAIIFVHPVKVISDTQYHYTIKIAGTTTSLYGIADMAGGHRCYINETDYIWLGDGSYVEDFETGPISITWGFPWQTDTLNRGG